MSMWCLHKCEGAQRGCQERALDLLKLELQVDADQLAWVLGSQFRPSVRAASKPTLRPRGHSSKATAMGLP